MRQCGECTLCCKLLPVVSLEKKANEKCKFQKFHKGCSVYNTRKMPFECKAWNCRWIINQDMDDMSRPDRVHYVIDHVPDLITVLNNETGEQQQIQAVVIWCDPSYPLAHRDPKLREYLLRRAKENICGMVRYNSYDSVVIFAPEMTTEKRWFEVPNIATQQPTFERLLDEQIKSEYRSRNNATS